MRKNNHPMYCLLLSAILFAASTSVSQTYQNFVPPAGIAPVPVSRPSE